MKQLPIILFFLLAFTYDCIQNAGYFKASPHWKAALKSTLSSKIRTDSLASRIYFVYVIKDKPVHVFKIIKQ